MNNTAIKFIKEYENYFLINSGRSSIFNNDDLNLVFQKFFKSALIIITFIKVCATEFVFFDNVVKSHLKKNINMLLEIICIIFGIFVISKNRELFYYRKEVVDKIEKISKSSFNAHLFRKNGKIQLERIISSFNSKYNHLSLNLRSFSKYNIFKKALFSILFHTNLFIKFWLG